jgi:hypothetical protein
VLSLLDLGIACAVTGVLTVFVSYRLITRALDLGPRDT